MTASIIMTTAFLYWNEFDESLSVIYAQPMSSSVIITFNIHPASTQKLEEVSAGKGSTSINTHTIHVTNAKNPKQTLTTPPTNFTSL